jgi:hypothetical protein
MTIHQITECLKNQIRMFILENHSIASEQVKHMTPTSYLVFLISFVIIVQLVFVFDYDCGHLCYYYFNYSKIIYSHFSLCLFHKFLNFLFFPIRSKNKSSTKKLIIRVQLNRFPKSAVLLSILKGCCDTITFIKIRKIIKAFTSTNTSE